MTEENKKKGSEIEELEKLGLIPKEDSPNEPDEERIAEIAWKFGLLPDEAVDYCIEEYEITGKLSPDCEDIFLWFITKESFPSKKYKKVMRILGM